METNVLKQEHQELPLGVSGLGGWLILVHIGIYGTILSLLVQLTQYSFSSFRPEVWTTLTSKGSELYHVLWGPVIVFEAIYNVLLFMFCIYILIMFYRKKWIFPRLMIIFYSVSMLVGIVDYVLVMQIPLANEIEDGSSVRDIIRSVLTCAIWIPYFLKSERVKNTFVK